MTMENRVPPEVVAAIAAALAVFLEVEAPPPFRLRGPTPAGREDAGWYGEVGLLRQLLLRDRGYGR
jgi:hypothetical protein